MLWFGLALLPLRALTLIEWHKANLWAMRKFVDEMQISMCFEMYDLTDWMQPQVQMWFARLHGYSKHTAAIQIKSVFMCMWQHSAKTNSQAGFDCIKWFECCLPYLDYSALCCQVHYLVAVPLLYAYIFTIVLISDRHTRATPITVPNNNSTNYNQHQGAKRFLPRYRHITYDNHNYINKRIKHSITLGVSCDSRSIDILHNRPLHKTVKNTLTIKAPLSNTTYDKVMPESLIDFVIVFDRLTAINGHLHTDKHTLCPATFTMWCKHNVMLHVVWCTDDWL